MAPAHCLLVTAALASLAGPALLQEPEEEKYLEELGHLQSGGHLTSHTITHNLLLQVMSARSLCAACPRS